MYVVLGSVLEANFFSCGVVAIRLVSFVSLIHMGQFFAMRVSSKTLCLPMLSQQQQHVSAAGRDQIIPECGPYRRGRKPYENRTKTVRKLL